MASVVSVDGIFDFATAIVDKLFTSDAEKQAALIKLKELEQSGDLAQIQVNTAEAAHESIFVAGWRPFIGWVCGFAFAYTYIIQPFLTFFAVLIAAIWGAEVPLDQLPAIPMSDLLAVLGGMLGLGWMRTQEKIAGANGNRTVEVAPGAAPKMVAPKRTAGPVRSSPK